jgi:hypothetical protein
MRRKSKRHKTASLAHVSVVLCTSLDLRACNMDYAEHRQEDCRRTGQRDDLSPTTRALSQACTEAEKEEGPSHSGSSFRTAFKDVGWLLLPAFNFRTARAYHVVQLDTYCIE